MRIFFVLGVTLVSFSTFALPQDIGGVSGGGGNILYPKAPTTEVDTDHAEHLVERSFNAFNRYIRIKKQAFEANQLPEEQRQAFHPLFTANKKIEDVINKYELHIEEESSCRTREGQPVDGSIFAPRPSAVCISSYSISRKTDITDIAPQAVALMVHEYSELLGVSEEQAVKAQAAALSELRGL